MAAVDHEHSCGRRWRRRAGRSAGEVPVGAVVVHDGNVIGVGFNRPISAHDPTAHAEVVALRAAAPAIGNYRLTDATMYVTVEPCLMCVGAMVHARIALVVYGVAEPKAGALQSMTNAHELPGLNHRLTTLGGVLERESRDLLQAFFRERREAALKGSRSRGARDARKQSIEHRFMKRRDRVPVGESGEPARAEARGLDQSRRRGIAVNALQLEVEDRIAGHAHLRAQASAWSAARSRPRARSRACRPTTACPDPCGCAVVPGPPTRRSSQPRSLHSWLYLNHPERPPSRCSTANTRSGVAAITPLRESSNTVPPAHVGIAGHRTRG